MYILPQTVTVGGSGQVTQDVLSGTFGGGVCIGEHMGEIFQDRDSAKNWSLFL